MSMGIADQIRAKLAAEFSPHHLEVVDDSEAHRGHAGYRDGGESHFHVTMAAAQLADMNRIARHRAVHKALGKELVGRIHALGLTLSG